MEQIRNHVNPCVSRLVAGVNTGRHEAYRKLISRGFRTEFQGVVMDGGTKCTRVTLHSNLISTLSIYLSIYLESTSSSPETTTKNDDALCPCS
jgi:hypothetical protein